MLKRDYIMRMLQEFLDALLKLTKSDITDKSEKINDLYKTYFKQDREFFEKNSIEVILAEIKTNIDEQSLEIKLEMLAELLYIDVLESTNFVLRKSLLEKTLTLFLSIDQKSNTYSTERVDKIKILKELHINNL